MLDRHRAERLADLREHRVAFGARVVPDTDLDQFMRVQIEVDFVQHRRRETVLADADDGMEVMRLRTERATLAG